MDPSKSFHVSENEPKKKVDEVKIEMQLIRGLELLVQYQHSA